MKIKIETFRGESSFKTWVFSIATNLSRDHKRVKSRWAIDVQDQCKAATIASKQCQERIQEAFSQQNDRRFEIAEHISYCFTCITKNLSLHQQLVVILREIYQFQRREIAEILQFSDRQVKHLLAAGREQLTVRYENRCALINKNGPCYQCGELNDYFEKLESRKFS